MTHSRQMQKNGINSNLVYGDLKDLLTALKLNAHRFLIYNKNVDTLNIYAIYVVHIFCNQF